MTLRRLILGATITVLAVSAQAQPLAIPVRIACDTTDPAMSVLKVEAGLSLALNRTARYSYMPAEIRDSMLRERTAVDVSALDGAQLLQAEYIVFASSRRIANLIHSEVVLRSVSDTTVTRRGIGFGTIRYSANGIALADPAIYTSMERAIAALDGDTTVPAPSLLSVGGFTFTDDSLATPAWQYLSQPTVNSYHLALSAVYALQSESAWTTIDLETRDAMMAMAGFYEVENDRLPTTTEARILHAFGIEYVVSGTVQRTRSGAEVSVVVSAVEGNGTLLPIATQTARVQTDSPEAFAAAVADALTAVSQRAR